MINKTNNFAQDILENIYNFGKKWTLVRMYEYVIENGKHMNVTEKLYANS